MTRKTTRTRAEAKKLMWEYYRDNRNMLPQWIREHREEIINNLRVVPNAEIVFKLISRAIRNDFD